MYALSPSDSQRSPASPPPRSAQTAWFSSTVKKAESGPPVSSNAPVGDDVRYGLVDDSTHSWLTTAVRSLMSVSHVGMTAYEKFWGVPPSVSATATLS